MKSRFALLLLLLLPLFAHAATPVAGVDYVEIPGGKPFAPLNGFGQPGRIRPFRRRIIMAMRGEPEKYGEEEK